MSVPLLLRRDAIGPLSPVRERERSHWETGTWFDEAVLQQDPDAGRLFADVVKQPEWDYDDERRELARYVSRVHRQQKHGGRAVARRLGYIPEADPFDPEIDEATARSLLLDALAACSAHAELIGGVSADDVDDDLGDDAETTTVLTVLAADPPTGLVAVDTLSAAPLAPPACLLGM